MEIDRYERWFMITTFAFILGAMAALIISVVGHHASLADNAGRIEPGEVDSTPPFNEPGLYETEDGYDLVLVARAWQWSPEEIVVPVYTDIRILATSTDVIHGLKIRDTNANVMVIPGQISEVQDVRFDEPGTYWLFCHEYCGVGHHNMGARVIAE